MLLLCITNLTDISYYHGVIPPHMTAEQFQMADKGTFVVDNDITRVFSTEPFRPRRHQDTVFHSFIRDVLDGKWDKFKLRDLFQLSGEVQYICRITLRGRSD